MTKEDALTSALNLISNSTIAMLGSNGGDGYPNIKAMIKMETEGLKTIWFSTNTSSKRVQQLRENPKASVYFVDMENWMGLLLLGDVEILSDLESRKRLWREGFKMYYPLGVTDPDYTVLRFTAKTGNYYHGLKNVTFEL